MTPKELRLAAGLSIERCAVAAGVTSPTIRLFEADPSAVPRARQKLETFYRQLASQLAANGAGEPPATTRAATSIPRNPPTQTLKPRRALTAKCSRTGSQTP